MSHGGPGGGSGRLSRPRQFVQPWTVATKGGGGGGGRSRSSRQLLEQQRARDAAENKARQAAMDRQRAQQAALFKQAQDRIAKLGVTSKQRITERGEQQKAAGTQSLVSRGLFNTTVLGSLQRGIESDVQRGLTDVDERVAGRSAGLFAQEAGLQIPEGQFQLGGINMMSGGLEDYIRLLSMLGGGLS